ncbi:MAG: hypothetical protein IPM83_11895 [Ignavibacteria bacterium]|nr:hypothetical protein [Ignavibacteria bacterium]
MSFARFSRKYYAVPQYVVDTLKAMPKDSHPMAMLSVGLLAMERESEFRAAYDKGAGKDALWQSMVNDSVRLIASIPVSPQRSIAFASTRAK